MPFKITWTSESFEDISKIYKYLSSRISVETVNKIIDEYRKDRRRIIVRDYKRFYTIINSEIFILRVFNTFQNPTKSL